ncbi:MAG: hypothetical protein AAFP69_07380 [Planctomycetota bacterium]
MRVMIIGGPGSGKSTLAVRLGTLWNLPVYHMDREVHWLPGWVERSAAEKLPLVEAIVAKEAWVFEGGHSSSYALRLQRADKLFWLDVPLWNRLFQITKRCFAQRGRTRSDLADNCPERLSMLPGFWKFMLATSSASRARQARLFAQATIEKYRFTSLQQVNHFLDEEKV